MATHDEAEIPDLPEDPSMTYSPEKTKILSATSGDAAASRPDHRTLKTSVWKIVSTGEKAKDESFDFHHAGASAPEAPEAAPAEAEVPAPAPPQFFLRKRIGRGGFGEVWEARQASLDRLVAIKRVRSELRGREAERRRGAATDDLFRQEAATTAYLEHPNIVPIHDLGSDPDGTPMLAMKLVRGRPWDAVLRDDFPAMSPSDFLSKHLPVLVEVSQAVAFAHSRGVIHRDIKPAQVMIGEFGETLLMDWGLAVWTLPHNPLGEDPDLDVSLTGMPVIDPPPLIPTIETASSPAGTPALMAPEQTLSTAHRITFRTDVYLLGGTLYSLLTGLFPHQARDSRESVKRAARGVVQAPEHRVPNRTIPPELSRLAMHALDADPDRRPHSVLDFIDALKDFLSGSSRRRDSVAATDELLERMQNPAPAYEDLERNVGLLERASALWPENPSLPILTERVLDDFARAALERGDLNLARFQAERMALGKTRLELLAVIEEREIEDKAHARQRRLLMACFFAVAILFGISMLVVAGWMAADKRELEQMTGVIGASRAETREKLKELDCIYAIAEAVHAEADTEVLLARVVDLLPPAWQHVDAAVARIVVGDIEYRSGNFAEPVVVQSARLVVDGQEAGFVEVGYTSDRPEEDEGPFLESERRLIDAVAQMLSTAAETRLP